MIFVVNSLAVL